MAGIYSGGEDDDFDGKKPHWDDEIGIGDIPTLKAGQVSKKAKKKKKKKKDVDSAGVEDGVDIDAMDAEVEPPEDDDEWDGTEEMRERKLNEYMDEIYGLEFNDIVCIPLYPPEWYPDTHIALPPGRGYADPF